MPIRTIETVEALKPWLPSDYLSTGWDDAQLQAALDDGHDPRLIAAEVWEEYANSLPEETGSNRPVKGWQNLDVSVEYGTATSPHDWAMKQARHHRSRSKVKAVALSRPRIEREEPEGLLNEPPAEEKTTTSGPRGQE